MSTVPRQLFCFIVLGLLGGCLQKGSPVIPTTTDSPPPYAGPGPKLEIDTALTNDGLAIVEKSRAGDKIVVTIRSTKKDHESTNYSFNLYDQEGKRLDSTAFSVPALKQDAAFDYEISGDDVPKASRVVIRYFGK